MPPSNKDMSPSNKDMSPSNKDMSPSHQVMSPFNKLISPFHQEISASDRYYNSCSLVKLPIEEARVFGSIDKRNMVIVFRITN